MVTKQDILKAFEKSEDLDAFDIIFNYLEENENKIHNELYEKIVKLLNILYRLNWLLIETETDTDASKYNVDISEIYNKIKNDLFNYLKL